jgi:hypothetical protein
MAGKTARELLEEHLESGDETEPEAADSEPTAEAAADEADAPDSEPDAADDSEPEAGDEDEDSAADAEPGDAPGGADSSAPEPPSTAEYYTPPPSSLNAAERESWQKWPAEARNTLLRREREFQQGLQQAFQRASLAERKNQEIDQVLQEHAQRMHLKGENVSAMLRRMVAWDQFLDDNPAQAVPQLLQAHGIGPQQLAQLVQNPQAFQASFANSAVEQKIAALEERLEREKQEFQQSQLQAFSQQMQAAREQFRSSVDGAGYLNDPSALKIWAHDVENLVNLERLPLDQAFHKAYERLIWGNPEYRAAHEKQKQVLAQKKRIEEEKRAAKKAQRAASSPQGAPDGAPVADKPREAGALLRMHFGA